MTPDEQKTPIVPIQKTETKYFGNEPVNDFWLEIPAAAQSGNKDNNYMDRLKTCLETAPKDGVICVFSEELSGKSLCESLAKARDNGNRIYILTNNYHDEMKNLEGCLIRYGGGRRIGSFILVNPNSNMLSGCLFTGRFSDGSINLPTNLLLDLDSDQVSVLFRYFCYQFWNKAKKERIVREEHDAGNAPLDIFPPVDDSCDFQHLKTEWGKETEKAFITTGLLAESPYMEFNNFSHSTVVSLLLGIDNSLVRSLNQKQNKIYVHDDDSLINSIKTPDGTWLIPKIDTAHEEEVYALLLIPDQVKILDNHIISLRQRRVQYQYFESGIREKLSGKTIFRLGYSVSQKYTMQAESRVKLSSPPSSELLPKDEFENLKPDFNDDGRSVLITYEWTNTPFTLPSGSKEHPLYQNWKDKEESIKANIDHILDIISENEKKKDIFSKLIARLFLAKQQKFIEYRNDLKKLKEIKYGAISKTELQENIKQINEIRSAVEKDTSEISEENRKARLEEQIAAKQKEKVELEGKLDDKRRDLQEIEGKIKFQSDSLKELEKQGEEKKEEIKEAGKKIDDLNVKKNRIENEIEGLKRDINKSDGSIENFRKQLQSPVKEHPKKETSSLNNIYGGEKKPNQSVPSRELQVPQLPQLPSVGVLYKQNNQDYLAIQFWEDFDKGKAEAGRLNAKLCAKGENNG